MPRFAANLTYLFTEVAMLERPDWAARCGFDGVEVLFPYDQPMAEWERALNGLPLALINTPPGDWASGDRGFAAVPGMELRFRDSFTGDLPPCRGWSCASATASCGPRNTRRGWARDGCM